MCIGNNKIQVTKVADYQWSVYWVDFPPPIGRRPGVIIGSDLYSDGVEVLVAPITTSAPRDKKFVDTWIPIDVDPDKNSYISINNMMSVHKGLLEKLIGYIPHEYRQSIKDRYIAMITGEPVDSLCIKPCKSENTGDTIAENTTPTSDESSGQKQKVNANVAMSILKSITDSTVDLTPSYKYMESKRLQASSIPDSTLSLLFVNMIRTYGYVKLEITPTLYRRYTAIKNELVNRNIVNEITMKFIQSKISLNHRDPSNT